MRDSILHLPEVTQEELNLLVELIKENIKECEMIILYGSYARDTFVIRDDKVEFGRHTIFKSDLDIMVVTSTYANTDAIEYFLKDVVVRKYCSILEGRRGTSDSKVPKYAPPSLISETLECLNEWLENYRSFYVDVLRDGIMLYDSGNCKLSKAKELSPQRIKEVAEREYSIMFTDGNRFLDHGYYDFSNKWYKLGSFELHQACERYYKTIELVFDNYSMKTHDLDRLIDSTIYNADELATIFMHKAPRSQASQSFEERCYDLLRRAYIEARYNTDFVVTKEELEYMLARVEVLKDVTERICTEQLKHYDSLIAGSLI